MAYAVVQPPFTLQFRTMTRSDLAGYRQWFFEIMPERLGQLAQAVTTSAGYEGWAPDRSPESLDVLGAWFAEQVQTRSRSIQEKNEIQWRSDGAASVSDAELTNRTFSLAMDVGIYLSQAMLARHPNLTWDQPLDDPQFIDYGQPVLTGFGPAPFNPVHIVVVFAYGVVRKTRTGKRLREVYDVWSKLAAKAGS